MFLRRPLTQPVFRAGFFSNIYRASGSSATQPLDASLHSYSGTPVLNALKRSFMEKIGVPSSCAMSTFIHSGEPKQFEGPRIPSRRIWDRNGRNFNDGFQNTQYEQNPDIVHIKMLRNNTFVTVTDSKGDKKFGLSAGKLADKGGQVSRYAAEASAEEAGRILRDRGIKAIIVKVNGYTFFKKKKQAILSLKEGYSHHRGDKHPIVYIEDTTRRAHNGCRLRKKRRV